MAYDLPQPAKIRATNFKLGRLQAGNPIRGGDYQGVDFGSELWTCEIETTNLDRAQIGLLKSLSLKTRGAMRTVYLYDASMQRPAAYPFTGDGASADEEWFASSEEWFASQIDWLASGGVKPWGGQQVAEWSRATSQLKLVECAPGAEFTPGDFGALDDGPARRLYQIVEPATADADGVCWVTVEPAPPGQASTYLPAAFIMERAAAEMRLTAFDSPWTVGQGWAVQLTGAQVIRRS